MRLRNKNGFLNSLPEGTPKKRISIDIGRWLYTLLLFSLIVYIIFFVISRFIYIIADGQVKLKEYYIQSPNEFKILNFYVDSGDSVTRGEAVVNLIYDLQDNNLNFEKMKINKNLLVKRVELKLLKKELTKKEKELKVKDNEFYKSIELFREDDVKITREIDDISFKMELIKSEIEALNGYLQEVDIQIEDSIFKEILYSPVSGTVQRLHKARYEYVKKGDTLITLKDENSVKIEGYFDLAYLKDLKINKRVVVNFPDGFNSRGIIKKIYSSAEEYKFNLEKDYQPLPVKIKVDIYPLYPERDIVVWKKYNEMDVKIKMESEREEWF